MVLDVVIGWSTTSHAPSSAEVYNNKKFSKHLLHLQPAQNTLHIKYLHAIANGSRCFSSAPICYPHRQRHKAVFGQVVGNSLALEALVGERGVYSLHGTLFWNIVDDDALAVESCQMLQTNVFVFMFIYNFRPAKVRIIIGITGRIEKCFVTFLPSNLSQQMADVKHLVKTFYTR